MAPQARLRVGFVGLGDQGGPIARRIIEAGFTTTVWARRPASLERFGATPRVAESRVALGAASDLVGICVVNDDDVRAVALGPEGVLAGMAPGSILAIHSTIHPDTVAEVASWAGERGVAVIDAPVSGGGASAGAGELLVMVGGDAAILEQCREVLSSFASNIIHLGPLGSGQVAKGINNMAFTASLGLALEATDLGAALGLDPAALLEVLSLGSASSFAIGVLRRSGGDLGAFSAGALLRKDADIVEALAAASGTQSGLLGQMAQEALGAMGAG
jgi:3-hydroxyisobutyrate dehydrogenase-like beta-hydroxyacid dehydrogenase